MTNKELYRDIARILTDLDKNLDMDKGDLAYYEEKRKSGTLNAKGLNDVSSKIVEVQKSMRAHRDNARRSIDDNVKAYIKDSLKPVKLDPKQLDLELANMLNAGFNFTSKDIEQLWNDFEDYTNRRLISDIVEAKEIQLDDGLRKTISYDLINNDEKENFENAYQNIMSTSIMGNERYGLNTMIDTEKGKELFATLLDIEEG